MRTFSLACFFKSPLILVINGFQLTKFGKSVSICHTRSSDALISISVRTSLDFLLLQPITPATIAVVTTPAAIMYFVLFLVSINSNYLYFVSWRGVYTSTLLKISIDLMNCCYLLLTITCDNRVENSTLPNSIQ